MREKFVPFITISCIGTFHENGKVSAPCEIKCQKISEKEYMIIFRTQSKLGKFIGCEINMQENKLFQDTTVESGHPTMNNAFGGTAFLGQTREYGEQWLYSRLELSNLPQLLDRKILKAVLHIPNLNHSRYSLTANTISTRFCSFGSTWKNKISISDSFAESKSSNGYYHLDITSPVRQGKNNFAVRVQPSSKHSTVISTGDSFYQPQILEVQFQ